MQSVQSDSALHNWMGYRYGTYVGNVNVRLVAYFAHDAMI